MRHHEDILGIKKGEMPSVNVCVPPPLYPLLEFKPLPLKTGDEEDYMLVVKKQLLLKARDSPFYIKPDVEKQDIERYTDKFQQKSNKNEELPIDWSQMPAILRPQKKGVKRKVKSFTPNVKVSRIDVDQTLDAIERSDDVDDEGGGGEGGEGEEGGEVVEDEQEADEEMDEGTDYANNYFDNGEGYLEDDDDDDDGPTY